MLKYDYLLRRRICYHLNRFFNLRLLLLLTFSTFIFIQFLIIKFFNWEKISAPESTRLFPDRPLMIDLRSYSVCHPKELYIENITSYYHRQTKQEICFLIEHLDGGPWWSYVSHEFAEILVHLKELGIRSNITYRKFSYPSYVTLQTNFTKHFLTECQFDENVERPIIILLLWNVDHLLWNKLHDQWKKVFKALQIRFMIAVDDLQFRSRDMFVARQYFFQSLASEIFSAYAYLFHNYNSVSSSKITWLPHAASSLLAQSINQSAVNRIFVSGANMYEWYPCRARAFLVCQFRRDLTACLEHPGYGKNMKNDSSFFYGQRYFAHMKQYVFGLGTCQSVHYAIAKLFEIPANGLALVTTHDLIPIIERLNLYHDKHFLTIECSTVDRFIDGITRLRNISKNTIDTMRIKSQKVVYERHLTHHRAELLHVRLLAQALIATSSSGENRMKWEKWGRNCD